MRLVALAVSLVLCAGGARAGEPARPTIDPRITPQVSRDFYACRTWEDWNARPVPSPERTALRVGGAARRGDRLTVAGHALRNIRSAEELEREWFQYVGRLSNAPVAVVLDHPYEGVNWIAIDRKSRGRGNLRGLPAASPGGRFLAVAASDPAFNMFGVQIYERTRRGLVAVVADDAPQYPCDLHWAGEERLEFRVARPQSEAETARGDARVYAPAAFQRSGGVWVYQQPPEVRR